MKMDKTLKNRLLLTTAMIGTALFSYGRGAYAACTVTTGNMYTCSGANTTGQEISAPDANVTTAPGFSVLTNDAAAVKISGNGDLVYTDTNAGSLESTNNGGVGTGLFVQSNSPASTQGSVTINTNGNIKGVYSGIHTANSGTGSTSITATGDITATNGVGIGAFNSAGSGLTINAVNVTGSNTAIRAVNSGTGGVIINTTGDVIGGVAGIYVLNSAHDLIINSGKVSSGGDGIYASNLGGNTKITTTGDVSGATNGIRAFNGGTGDTTIVATGGVVGGGDGISGRNALSAHDLTIRAANVAGYDTGIRAYNAGTGSTTIVATGNVTASLNTGIRAEDLSDGTGALTIQANGVKGRNYGIFVFHRAAGELNITATGDVEGEKGSGIVVDNSQNATDLKITAAKVTGDNYGIVAKNFGTGDANITTTGDVQGGKDGINVLNGSPARNLTINSAKVSGGSYGIFAINRGTADTAITATGDVTGLSQAGIGAYNDTTARNLNITATNVNGSGYGISARNAGTGDTTITASGDVVGGGDGISGRNALSAHDLTIRAANVAGNDTGIRAYNAGTGSTTIVATGNVTALSGKGIRAEDLSDGTGALTIQANGVKGGKYGIFVFHRAAGELNITATGDVQGEKGFGIFANSSQNATDLKVNAVKVTGGAYGIYARNFGTGDTNITTTGDVQGGKNGTDVSNAASAGNMTVEATNISGGFAGVHAENGGVGDTRITTTGHVTGATSNGVQAYNGGGTRNLIINAASVTGGYDGIQAKNNGMGDTSIASTGDVAGAGHVGIYALNSIHAKNLTITSAKVTGGVYGISVQNIGTGSTSISSTGDVTAQTKAGIRATNEDSAGDLNISATNVKGGTQGILSTNRGAGNTTIAVTGDINGGVYGGIYALNAHNAVNLDIKAHNVSGGTEGVYAVNYGSGDAKITTTGDVIGTGSKGLAIFNAFSSQNAIIDAEGSTRGTTAIGIRNDGSGGSTIVNNGDAVGTTKSGIDAFNSGRTKGNIDITIGSLGSVRGALSGIQVQNEGSGGTFITNNGLISNLNGASTGLAIAVTGKAPVTITNTGVITGTIDLSGGKYPTNADSTFNNNGTWNTASGTNEFGGGNDTLINTSAKTLIAASNAAIAELTQFNGLETFINRAPGVLTLADGGTGDVTRFSGNFAGEGGSVRLDAKLGGDNSATDMIVVGGNVSGSSLLFVNNVGGTGARTQNGIKLIDVAGTSTASAFMLGAPVDAGAYGYRVLQKPTDQGFYLSSVNADGSTIYSSGVPIYENLPKAMQLLNQPGTLQQRVGNRYWQRPNAADTADANASGAKPVMDGNGIWARIEGAHNVSKPDISTASTQFDADTWKLQSGADFQLADTADGRLIGGVFASYGQVSANITSPFGGGKIDVDGYGIGTSLTWYGDTGFYADALAQYSWFDTSLASSLPGGRGTDGIDGTGYALSIEAGKRFEMANGFIITPQAQLIYSSVDFDSFTDKANAAVSLKQGDSFRGRLGINVEHQDTFVSSNGTVSRTSVYGIANLYYEFLNGSKVSVAGLDFANRDDRLWGGLGIGGSYNWHNDKYSLYGEASINSSLEGAGSYAVNGNLGMRVKW
ncbi:autotransporter outer membrane beta-barrel domain-containing protein (plasmid) [Phyllobacterium sp. 628]|uniref:autotransporter outer membrane beta-barrel domain-containing protein n=1 Tax=Phyllobacterium sp. 628 TaxID=2718938 RepID=UPI0016625BA3|nr:autotransporter outer membrane beta-barrel domain-containing protein [Phyllobacterium sp. 628]QND54765.1 autotransporter outer membrane beta-barrel domain-containing protein [Phyllobacterium sp. 628]